MLFNLMLRHLWSFATKEADIMDLKVIRLGALEPRLARRNGHRREPSIAARPLQSCSNGALFLCGPSCGAQRSSTCTSSAGAKLVWRPSGPSSSSNSECLHDRVVCWPYPTFVCAIAFQFHCLSTLVAACKPIRMKSAQHLIH